MGLVARRQRRGSDSAWLRERDLSGDRDENSGLLERVHLAVRAVPPSDIRSVDRSKVLRAWRSASGSAWRYVTRARRSLLQQYWIAIVGMYDMIENVDGSMWVQSLFMSHVIRGRLVSGLSDSISRSGEVGSPKRGRGETCTCLSATSHLSEVCVFVSECMTRSGEPDSPQQANVVQPLFSRSLRRGELA
ncbi:hypothetical protein DEO72_LG6g1001 [Vigna unguiculata]|uniref:Uncharacterized protein n=1 Tax=Vigna unguiculata TaxID=3917 RepID=A0A4D6M4N3_VIGUN|nr:hypothetical protein DEO72_LG6g1001 [Vigna unguiculata]